jgi:hypothetical protein
VAVQKTAQKRTYSELADLPNAVGDFAMDQTKNSTQPVDGPLKLQEPAPPTNSIDSRKALGGYAGVGNMLGFNTAMDYPDDKAANSMKNTAGRIMSRYGNNKAGFEAIFDDPNDPNDAFDADWARYFPNATWDGRDKINFGGMLSDFESGTPVYDVDVSKAWSGDAGEGWTWQDLVNDGGGQMGGGSMGPAQGLSGAPGGQDILTALMGEQGMNDNGLLQQIQAELQKMLSGGAPSAPGLEAF